ncbi:hypothetical protein Salat_2632000 [Sesamum alatum]|uniref:Uncharacterized protein n=1 Tax=Sesamum alatum TaxID=300844 RepID=A0AAE2CAR9_9LAMI|nr:hypothetical protein Salat_2632000 [Sesamum alatum]
MGQGKSRAHGLVADPELEQPLTGRPKMMEREEQAPDTEVGGVSPVGSMLSAPRSNVQNRFQGPNLIIQNKIQACVAVNQLYEPGRAEGNLGDDLPSNSRIGSQLQ